MSTWGTRRVADPAVQGRYPDHRRDLAALQPGIAAGQLNGIAIRGVQQVIVKGKEQPVCLYAVSMLSKNEPFRFSECPAGEPLRLTEK
jgi:hypothetical protein